MLKNRWYSGECSIVLLYVKCTCCKPSQCLSFPLPDKLAVLSNQSKHWLQNSLVHRPTEVLLPDIHLATVSEPASRSFLLLSTTWSEVASALLTSFASPGILSRNENTELCCSQESWTPPFPVPELCSGISSWFLRISLQGSYHKY